MQRMPLADAVSERLRSVLALLLDLPQVGGTPSTAICSGLPVRSREHPLAIILSYRRGAVFDVSPVFAGGADTSEVFDAFRKPVENFTLTGGIRSPSWRAIRELNGELAVITK